ncbi:hypothetical protein K5V21_02205 [Clostridium sardiniense]|uniref:HNH nuclease domain-containing protein n=1 Tax=Clostridium sardiniense TaxID=29369 RepID=A0ABS7KTY0_CLOSR|nr:hypothetical protein [Clostridium sardiniense]MBY0754259.1 hypothetical protein [Clostridium sardiniense]
MENNFKTEEGVTFITILKKNGDELIAKIDSSDLDSVKSIGTWFAEWNKDFNNYLVLNISNTEKNKKNKPLKQSLQSIILNVSSTTPIRHINGNTLDNRRCNLEIVQRNTKNEYEKIDADTFAISLKDKYGKEQAKALISSSDLHTVVNDDYSWVYYRNNNDICVIANTPDGRIHLDRIIMKPSDSETIHHINLNPLDNRRSNLEKVEI